MPRLMSVAMTEQAVVERRKTVTRRLGWKNAKPGDRYTLVRKAMGRRKKGPDGKWYVEPLVRLVDVEVVDARPEPLLAMSMDLTYGQHEVEREGFPGMDPDEFIDRYFVRAQGCTPETEVTRIEWRYLDDPSGSHQTSQEAT